MGLRRSKAVIIGQDFPLPGALPAYATQTGDASDTTDSVLAILENPGASVGQLALAINDGGTNALAIPWTGGAQVINQRVGAQIGFAPEPLGALLDGTQNPPCLTLADIVTLSCGVMNNSQIITNASNFPGIVHFQAVIGYFNAAAGQTGSTIVLSGMGTGSLTLQLPWLGATGTANLGFVVDGWRIWSGTGAPSTTTVGVCAVGDWYLRRDTPSTANQRIYMCTVASSGIGNAGTWVGIA